MSNGRSSPALRAYARSVASGVDCAIAAGATTLPAVMAHLPGVFPLVIAEQLRARGLATNGRGGGETPTPSLKQRPNAREFLLPHPLDYDWRFSRAALETLDRAIRRVRPDQPEVSCFGCPSVAKFFRCRAWRSAIRLFDRNGSLHETGTVSWNAASDRTTMLAPGVVVADPPWYSNHFRQFLWAIRESCGLGADVFLAGPPVGTRPGVRLEMNRLFAWARKAGFDVVTHHTEALPYVMPLFELNTLKAYGANNVPLDWRKADLWHLKLRAKPHGRRPACRIEEGIWEERRFGPVRIRVRIDQPQRGNARLRPLGAHGFLNSVSSRDPLRKKATVVTSGGRFFSCSNPIQLLRSELEPASRAKKVRAPRLDGAPPAKWDLPQLVATEQMESARYYELVRKVDGL
jgi:hypothetical protein